MSTRTKFNGQSLLNGSLTTSQMTGTASYVGGDTQLAVGTTAFGGNGQITGISVADAQSAKGYVFATSTKGATYVTMEQVDLHGTTTGVSETINVSDIASKQSEQLNFTTLGVNVTVDGALGTVGAAALVTDLAAATSSIDTSAGNGTAVLQTGANQGDETDVAFVNTRLSGTTGVVPMDTLAKALTTFQSVGGATRDNASALITALDGALGSVSSSRAILGAAQNRLQHTIDNLGTTSENLSAANSRIVDVDVATESSAMAKNQVLEQAGVSVLAQANQLPQLALKLLG
jgi:flagellin